MHYCEEVHRVELRRRNTMDISHDALTHNISSLRQSKDYTIAFGRMTPKPKPSFNKDNKHRGDEEKKDETSRLYRTRPPLNFRKIIPASKGRIDIAGEPNSTPRKCRTLPTKRLETPKMDKKLKPSQIPMRKLDNLKKKPSKEKTQNLLCQKKNIQRVQVYNTVPEMLDVPVSLASTKPIPTLGQIYGNAVISSDVFNDFFLGPVTENLEMHFVSPDQIDGISNRSPESVNTIASTNRGHNFFLFTEEDHPTRSDPENTLVSDVVPSRSNVDYRPNVFQTTNDNVRDWLAYELDHPTRDNESGYHSDSRAKIVSNGIKSNASLDPKAEIIRKYSLLLKNRAQPKKSVSATDVSKSSGGDSMTVQETVLIATNSKPKIPNPLPKMNTETKPLKPPNEFYATFKFSSTPNPARKRDVFLNINVPSYVECPSEVLQKTTNFETEGHDTSSTEYKDLSLPDDLSNDAVGENADNFSETTDQYDWRLPSSQCSAIFRSSKCSETTDGSWRRKDDLSQYKPSSDFSFFKCAANCSYHEYYYHYCWRKEVANREHDFQKLRDSVGRCKKCQKYRRYTHKNNKISKRFVDFKNRMTFGRGCKHRWNRVWKKTTQRITKWSKSPERRFRMMHYLLQRNNWDNAVVQTPVLVYNERG